MKHLSIIVPAVLALGPTAYAAAIPAIVYVTQLVTVTADGSASTPSSSFYPSSLSAPAINTTLSSSSEPYSSAPFATPEVYVKQEEIVEQKKVAEEPTTTTPTTIPTPEVVSPTPEVASPTPETQPESDSSDFKSQILAAHNNYRLKHQAGSLTWDSTLAAYAQNNANNYDCSGTLTHTGGQYGENLAAGYASGSSAVDGWYDEIKDYNWADTNTYNHFTQVVWKDTTKLGCAYKQCGGTYSGLYVICEYNPAGNMVGSVAQNVLPA